MAYERQNFIDGVSLPAEQMNHIEDGILELEKNKLDKTALPVAIDDALAKARESGEFDGADGKSAYTYAQEGGYGGTEEEFAAKLAENVLAPFYITLTADDTSEWGYTIDKTGAEIIEAYNAGRLLVCYLGDSIYHLYSRSSPLNGGHEFWFGASVSTAGSYFITQITTNASDEIESIKRIYYELAKKEDLTSGNAYTTITIAEGDQIDEYTYPATSSMTFEEILLAWYNGRSVYAVYENMNVPLMGIDMENGVFTFVTTMASLEAGGIVAQLTCTVNMDGTASVSTFFLMHPSALPNPNPLTINGTSYDGASATDMTEAINNMIDAKLGVIENGSY